MNSKLFKQIRNEWRSNLWILVELLIVSVVMWYITDYMYVIVSNYICPRGFDISHCYHIEFNQLPPNSPNYNPADTLENEDISELLSRLQHRPEIEAASISQNSYPYNGSNSTTNLSYDTINTNMDDWIIRRLVTPDFVKVFRYQGANGETTELLSELIRQNKIIITDNMFNKHGIPSISKYIGKGFKLDIDTTKLFYLGATIKPVKYFDFENNKYSYCFLYNLPKEYYAFFTEMCVRVKENDDHNFIDNLWKDSDKELRVGNIYISNIQSFKNIRTDFQRSWVNDIRNYIVGGIFLMLNIFLGILGTFWFRTQQRKGEIALFKALGSSNKDVFNREIAEGLILLSFATILAIVIDINLAHASLNTSQNGIHLETVRFILTVFISYLLTSLMIVLGIWSPAKNAMNIQPAEALHEE